MTSMDTVKLNNAFVPIAYDLKIEVDLATWSYEAHEVIQLRKNPASKTESDVIQLHAAPTMEILSIDHATLLNKDPVAQTLHLQLASPTAEEHEIRFSFRHRIQEELRGFYQARFQKDGVEHRMASTHFEPTAARLFYICQDEPAQRADFTLQVSLPAAQENYTVLSNGPLREKKVRGDVVEHVFATIPKCPPYLTACVVGELECIETAVRHTPVRVYTTPGKSGRARFALKVVAFALEYFETFFQCEFPLPKLDVVAVPDFPIGGMENWGCITCVESVLVDEATSSLAALKRASDLLCHEVSHNWFGNLVAISWWEGLWLKEGFASWCGKYASHVREPSWNFLEDAAELVAFAMGVDMFAHSHPVEVPIRDPADITQIFDSISYNKGMGLVFMLQAFLGPEKWGRAVAHYINAHRYKDTATVQLWRALEESTQLPVEEAMTSFTTQQGYPLVHVSRTAAGTLRLSQQPCVFASALRPPQRDWCIPLVIAGEGGEAAARVTTMLRGNEATELQLSQDVAGSAWLTANPQRSGFYRCRYDDATFQRWLTCFSGLDPADRRAIISDTTAAIAMGFDDVPRLAHLAEAVRATEKNTSVLRELYGSLQSLIGSFDDADLKRALRMDQLSFFIPQAEAELDVRPTSNEAKLRRTFLITTALKLLISCATAEDAEKSPLVAWARTQAEAFLSGGGEYATDTLEGCLVAYARLSNGKQRAEAISQTFYNKFTELDGDDELSRALIQGMCMSPDLAFVEMVAVRCMENKGVRSQFGGNVFAAMAANQSFAEGQVWRCFQRHFDKVKAQWGGGQFRIQVIVELVGSTLSGASAAAEFEKFFQSHELPNATLAIGRAVESIRQRAWINNKWKSSIATILKHK